MSAVKKKSTSFGRSVGVTFGNPVFGGGSVDLFQQCVVVALLMCCYVVLCCNRSVEASLSLCRFVISMFTPSLVLVVRC